ncbi:cation-transporting P-type ATPase, partial [Streptococcus agalactiae]|uniref:cation-transporting P-type ATPase n=1 Tax=Streptococcus agalactiae TaxID=1311 RepID=UPI0030101229
MNAWHSQSIAELEHLIITDVERGLTDEEVAARLVRNGPNKLRKGKRFSALVIFLSQFKSLVIW